MANKYIARYGAMRFLGEFQPKERGATFVRGDVVVLRTERGLEKGEILCVADSRTLSMLPDPKSGDILRKLTRDDEIHLDNIAKLEEEEFETCCQFVARRKLNMQVVDVEHIFGGERIVFYFLAEQRVDFRELVKDLAREYKTRIELRQIGIRDEAKLLADYGDCGRPVCCNTHMTKMPPVSMRMAKLQKSTLDPAKISGRCGRLKCCLRFEQDVYEEYQRALPPVGARILTRKGKARVLAQEILARRVLVEFEDGRRIAISADEMLTKL